MIGEHLRDGAGPINFDYLIVIEGTDGAGKATQSIMLRDWMMKNKIKNRAKGGTEVSEAEILLLDFPDYKSDTGKLVQKMLNGGYGNDAKKLNPYFTSPMYSLDRYAYMRNLTIQHGFSTDIGICNRYTLSNLIHQGARLNNADLIKYWAWLEDFEYHKLDLPIPDLIIYLDLPVVTAHQMVVERAKQNGIALDIQENFAYMELVDENVKRISKLGGWEIIQCYNYATHQIHDIETIQKKIQEVVTDYIIKDCANYDSFTGVMEALPK